MIPKCWGYEYEGKIMRKWQKEHYTHWGKRPPDKSWRQVPLSMWDYSGHKVVEFEPVKEEK